MSVVLAAYNAAPFLMGAYRSILAQTLPPTEIVVADDASTDGTAALVRRLAASDPRVRLLTADRNAGPAAARNRAIAAATGDWLAVMDCDDFLAPDRLATVVRADADVVLDNAVLLDPADWGSVATVVGPAAPAALDPAAPMALDPAAPMALDLPAYLRRILWARNHVGIGILKPVLRRAFLQRTGLRYREALRHGEDSFLILDALCAGARVVLSPAPTYFYTLAVSAQTGRPSPTTRTDKMGIDAQIAALRAFAAERPVARPAVRALVQSRASILVRRALRARDPRHLRSVGPVTLAQTLALIARERVLRRAARRRFGRRPDLDAIVAGFRSCDAPGGVRCESA